jgi:GMP synthase (glutamine-hydrolysing)
MTAATVLTHVSHEGPQRIAELLAARGVPCVVRSPGAAVPRDLPANDLLVVMGGPMGVADIGDPRWPFLADEVRLVRKHRAAGGRVLGVCLGAQLLAHAAGARVYPNHAPGDPTARVREVGWGQLDLHGAAAEPMLRGLPARITTLHWHGDTFDLPEGAVLLASTPACRNQAFRLGRRAVALQCHPEVDRATVRVWCAEDRAFAELAHGPGTADRILAEADAAWPVYRAQGDVLLGAILDELLAP